MVQRVLLCVSKIITKIGIKVKDRLSNHLPINCKYPALYLERKDLIKVISDEYQDAGLAQALESG
jgi:hypothetical protein